MYQVSGKVIKGDGYGKTLGFPTANIDRRDFVKQNLKIKLGVWSGFVIIQNSKSPLPNPPPQGEGIKRVSFAVSSPLRGEARRGWYKAGIVIGPIDKKGLPKIEAHLIGFKGSLYGKKITIELKKYLRAFIKYKNIELLKKQITKDIALAKKII